jgi:hypothetical protein
MDYKFDGATLRDRNGNKVAVFDGKVIRDAAGKTVGQYRRGMAERSQSESARHV